MNRDEVGTLPLKIVVPLTAWQEDKHRGKGWLVRIEPDGQNGLTKPSAADTFEILSISERRVKEKIGELAESDFEKVLAAIKDLF